MNFSKIYKGYLKLNNKMTKYPIKYWAKTLNRYLIKDDKQIVNKHMKTWPASYSSKDLQIKTQ